MGKETAGGLRLIDTDKFFASLAGRLDDEVFYRVAAAFAESCGRGGARHVIAHANLSQSELRAARKGLCPSGERHLPCGRIV